MPRLIRANIWNKHYKKDNIWQNRKPTVYVKDFKKLLRKGARILEIGFGKGNDLIYFKKQGFDCYGIEISRVAVERANDRAKGLNLKIGKAERLPFKSGFFDGVYCVRTLYHLNEKLAIPEMIRVLRKGGILYLSFVTSMIMLKMMKNIEGVSEKSIIKLCKGASIVKRKPFTTKDKNYNAQGVVLILRKN